MFLLENINSEDVVIHLAGVIDVKNNKKEQTMKINYEGTKLITDICIEKKVKRYIYFSSVDCIYKENDEEVFEPTKIYPDKFIDNYSHSKALATEYVMEARTNTDIPINIVYPSAVIGTNDFKPSSIGNVVSDIIDGKMQFGIKGGYNFVDVDDVVNATISIINNELEGDYLLTGTNVTVYELYDKVNEQLKKQYDRLFPDEIGNVFDDDFNSIRKRTNILSIIIVFIWLFIITGMIIIFRIYF